MANATHDARGLKIGKLSAEEAERISASFRPIWELDDAPFAQAQPSAMSAAEIDALAGGAGVAPSVRTTELQQQHHATVELKPQPVSRVPSPDEPKVEIAIDLDLQPDPTPAPIVAQARAQAQAPTAARKPYAPPRPPPATVKMSRDPNASGELVPVKKSNTGLLLAGAGVVLVIGGIFGLRSLMSGSSTTSAATTATTSEPTPEATHIPPPPPDTATVAATATQEQPPVQQAAETHTTTEPPPPAETHATEPPPPPVTTHAPPPPTHVAHTTTPHPTTTGHGTTHPHTGHASIVRDNPF